MEPRKKSKVLALLILLVVFGAGIGAGVGGTFYYLKLERQKRAERSPDERKQRQLDRMEERLSKALDLSEEQKGAVRSELELFRESVRELNRQSRRAFRQAFRTHSEKVKALLDPEQRERYEAYLKRRAQRRDASGSPRSNPGRMSPAEGSEEAAEPSTEDGGESASSP